MKWFLIILLILVIAVLLAAGYVVFAGVLDTQFKMPGSGKKKEEEEKPADDGIDGPNDLMRPTARKLYAFRKECLGDFEKLPLEDVWTSSFDSLKLHGRLLKGDPKEVVICVHGYRSSVEEDFADRAKIYADRGSTVLFVDDRSHGKSEGRYIGFSELDRFDVKSWVDWINEHYEDPRIYLHGVSMGGATVVHCADMHLKNLAGIIADCPFDSIRGITRALMKESYKIPYFPVGYIAGFWSKILAGIDFDRSQGEVCAAHSDVPMVFIHGKTDNFVPCEMSAKMYEACTKPKKILYVDKCGHGAAYMLAKEEYTDLVNELLDGKIQ